MNTLEKVLIEKELKDIVLDYLDDAITLREFDSEFVSLHWDTKIEWGYRVSLLMAEYTNGHLTEKELRNSLKQFILMVQI
jgi:predicted SAM-dependent methyltransferase